MTASLAIIRIFTAIGLALAWRSLLHIRRTTNSTTLASAWSWAAVAAGLWTVAWVMDQAGSWISQSVADHLWYGSAVVALCPAIAVLGSRRPGTRVWTAFIQIPLLFVLGWPVIALLVQGDEIRGLQLETPQFIAYLLVLIMGAGNYVGTRYTIPAFCYAAGLALIALSSSAMPPVLALDRWSSRVWATGLMCIALVTADRLAGRSAVDADRFDRLWLDFFDQFGVVWGRRIQDRINHVAAKEQWPGRLELHGFAWTSAPDQVIVLRVEHTFRWLLRRFVDPAWIDKRLGTKSADGQVAAMTTDS